jgi:hypothetical protein
MGRVIPLLPPPPPVPRGYVAGGAFTILASSSHGLPVSVLFQL